MFEELDKKEESNSGENENNPKENIANSQEDEATSSSQQNNGIEDIFSDGEDDLEIDDSQAGGMAYNEGKKKPAVFTPIDKENSQNTIKEEKKSPFLKIFIFIIIFGLILIGAYFLYNAYLKDIILNKNNTTEQGVVENEIKDEGNINKEPLENIVPENNEVKNIQENKINNTESNNAPVNDKDTDGDGLSDQKEIELGLNINSIDTDQDGLFDREEVMVYGTDPKNKDTDGDGFSDGNEVKDGYNPKGPGKLYDINQQ